jgi:hypothetical protein
VVPGACPCRGGGRVSRGRLKRWQIDRGTVTSAISGSVASTVGRVQRFKDAIAERSSPGLALTRANRHTVEHSAAAPAGENDASVTIRPPIPTPAQRAAQRFSAIRVRSLNDTRRGLALTPANRDTDGTAAAAGENDASVPIRLLILSPGQRVSRIRAETDVRQLKPSRIGMCAGAACGAIVVPGACPCRGGGHVSRGRLKRWQIDRGTATSAISGSVASTVGRVQRFKNAIAERSSPGRCNGFRQ